MRRAHASSAAFALALAFAGDASAYCRTTTVPIPAGYNPTQNGCIGEGTPLVWPSMPVTYEIEQEASSQIDLAEATAILDRSFAKWSQVACSEVDPMQHPDLSFRNEGPTDAGYAGCEAGPCGFTAQDAPHVILFRDSVWPYNDPTNTLALTTVTYGVETGHIFVADTEINTTPGHTISITTPAVGGAYSLEAIMTHEAGHFIGLAHSPVSTAVMYAYYQKDAITLTQDDTDAICAAYPIPGPSKGCSAGAANREGGAAGAVALALGAGLARRRWRSTRARRRHPRP